MAERELLRLKGGGSSASNQQDLNREFQAFLGQSGETPKTSPERDALFREFLQWRDKQGGKAR